LVQDDSQDRAYFAAINPETKRLLITGGAGTGKSTLIGRIAKTMPENIILCSPTGKASARLREVTGFNAYTIHQLLLYDGERFNRKESLAKNTVIVDEASMLDSQILAKLLSYEPGRIILVGDVSQLLPVGHGSPFADLIAARPDITYTLTHCHRASGAIHKAALLIREGKPPAVTDDSGSERWSLKETGPAAGTTEAIIAWIRAGLYDPERDIILSPRYGDGENDAGIDALNVKIKALVNPSDSKWGVNDRVIFTKNHGADDLWNGDTGKITAIDSDDNLYVTLDDEIDERKLDSETKRELRHAYALSVHKSQGSEYRRVFYCCLDAHRFQLNRNLTYTAITRAREGCVVLGQLRAFYASINKTQVKRTVLQHLFSVKGVS
jgi:exodeoxyribonuclease V alpha subunit